MPRLLTILGFVAFVIGAVSVALGLYVLLTGVIGWNPFAHGRPLPLGVTSMVVMLVVGLVLLAVGAMLAVASARAQWRREMQAMVAP